MPFGAGPHKCIGMDFALMEMTMVIAFFVRKYHLEAVSPDPVATAAGISLRPAQRILVRATVRE